MNRTLVGIGLAAILLGGCASGTQVAAPGAPAPGSPAAPATPAAPTTPAAPAPTTPTASEATPTRPSPRPGGAGWSTSVIPADHGTALTHVRLPREDERRFEEQGPWTAMGFRLTCIDGGDGFELWALDDLEASRLRQRDIPEGSDHDGLLQFATAEKAAAFMDQASAAYAQCPTTGPESGNQGTESDPVHDRTRMASGSQGAPGEQAFTVRTWTERRFDDRWLEAPGGGVTLWARKGSLVAFSSTGGEYVGDTLREAAEGTPTFKNVVDLLGRR